MTKTTSDSRRARLPGRVREDVCLHLLKSVVATSVRNCRAREPSVRLPPQQTQRSMRIVAVHPQMRLHRTSCAADGTDNWHVCCGNMQFCDPVQSPPDQPGGMRYRVEAVVSESVTAVRSNSSFPSSALKIRMTPSNPATATCVSCG